MTTAQKFDRAEVTDKHGDAVRTLTYDEFWAMGLVERITLLTEESLRFFKGDKPIKASDAVSR